MLLDVPGADPNIFVGNVTCLWHAVHSPTLLRMLLTHGANPYVENDGMSVLEHIYQRDPSQGDAIMDALSAKHRRLI
jgi:hypothetical protein